LSDTAEYDDGETEYETKLRILKSSMPFVHSLGWTHNAIAKGKLIAVHTSNNEI